MPVVLGQDVHGERAGPAKQRPGRGRAGRLNITRDGSSDRDEKDWQVNPAGPSFVAAVMTVNPVAK